jgi:hypothetical protein
MKESEKTPVRVDLGMRAKEEFAEYWPKALQIVDQRALAALGVPMPMMVDVFRSVYTLAFAKGAHVQLEELVEEGKKRREGS